MTTITILHNPRCSKSREAVKAAEQIVGDESATQVTVRHYLKEPLSHQELTNLLATLSVEPSEMVRSGDKAFKELGLTAEDIDTAEKVTELLAEHPALMQRPVLWAADGAVIGRPTQAAEQFLRQHL